MNPFLIRIALRPRTPLESLDLAALFIRDHARPFLHSVALCCVLPALVFGALQVWVGLAAGWGVLVAVVWLAPLLQPVFMAHAARLLFEPDVPMRSVFRDLWAHRLAFAQLLGVRVLGAGVALMSMFMLLPFWMVLSLFANETLMLERGTLWSSAQRAIWLSTEDVGRAVMSVGVLLGLTLWVVLCTEALAQALLGVVLQVGAPFGRLSDGDPTPWATLGVLLAQPVVAWARIILYVDVRAALEGWDLQIDLRAAAEEAEA